MSYKDWLLVSDIDGTLIDGMRRIPKANKDAVSYFVNNGGNFTLCTGRNFSSMARHYKNLDLKGPAIFLNGAGIYDFKNNRLLNYSPLSLVEENAVKEAARTFKLAEVSVYTVDCIYSIGKQFSGFAVAKADNLKRRVCKDFSEIPQGSWGKVNFFASPKVIKKLKAFFDEKNVCNAFFTSKLTLEAVGKDVNKGSAVLKLSQLLGIEKEKTAAIGDYYNDIEMLKTAAHPVCCGQAPKDIKELSEYVACKCTDGAVADFINYIIKKYIKTEGT